MNILEACLGEKRFEQIVSECQTCLKKSVGGKYGQSTEAASFFLVKICLELLSNEHTWGLSWWETICVNWLWISALPWKICCNWRKIQAINRSYFYFLCPVMFRIAIQWTHLRLVLARNYLHELAMNWALPRKICWRKIRAINRSCVCFLCPVMFRITI